jgi:hypothetical protein
VIGIEMSSGHCLCGDPGCSLYKPPLGSKEEEEMNENLVCQWLEYNILDDFPEGINVSWLADELTERLYRDNKQRISLPTPIKGVEVKSLILEMAKQWDYEQDAVQGGPLVQEEV